MPNKSRLSRRVKKQYDAILRGDASSWFWPYPGWGVPNQPKSDRGSPYRNEWAALVFVKEWGGRSGVDVHRLQRVVLDSCNPACATEWARHVPGANVRRLQDVVARHGDAAQIRRFARLVDGADATFLEGVAIVAEVMAA